AAGTGEKESSGGEGKESPQVVAEDVFERIAAFRGPVILFNGDKDKYVPLENTQKACEAYENAKLVVLKGSGHGFSGKARDTVKEKMVSFVWEVMKERE
ncbi:MAG: alpha/beta hydrolase, partial [Blautia sp.]|nr:alpha/beta hydrolase [Blautia sp.]